MNPRKLIVGAAILSLVVWSNWLHADGKETFDKSCKSCHGADGKGSAGMATGMKVDLAALDLTDAATKAKPSAELETAIKDGKGGKMPAFGAKLNADQIKEVTTFIKGL